MANILVTGGSHAEMPLIEALHAMGYNVITTGSNRDGLGHALADIYEYGDFSDPNFVLSLAEKYNVKGIVSGCNDFAYISSAYACDRLGLQGHDSYEKAKLIHSKNLFKDVCKKLNLHIPDFFYCKNIDDKAEICEKIGYPLIVKPIDLTGGKGVSSCSNFEEVKKAFKRARECSRQEEVIVEKQIVGTNHGISAMVYDSKVKYIFFDDEQYYINKYLVRGACTSVLMEEHTKKMIISEIETLFLAENLADGLFHCQYIVDEKGVPYIIDPCRRSPGDLYVKLASYAVGVDYPKKIVEAELGLKNVHDADCGKHLYIARECIMTDKNGTISDIIIRDDIGQYIKEKLVWGKKGDIVEDYTKYKAGIVIFEFPSADIMEYVLSVLNEKMYIEVTK